MNCTILFLIVITNNLCNLCCRTYSREYNVSLSNFCFYLFNSQSTQSVAPTLIIIVIRDVTF